MEYSRKQIAESVKNKYPEYASIDNDQLADSILKKYPQYRTKLDDGGILDTAKIYTQAALAGFSDVGYATLEGVASGISRLTGDSDLVKTVSDFRNYSKDFYEGSVSDEDKSKFGYKAVTTIAQTPAYMAAAATGPIGLAALTANAYQQGRDDYLSTQGVTSVSASEDQLKEADKVGAFSAIPIVALERIGASKLVNNIFKGKSTVTIREAARRIGSSALGEGLTEGSQTIFQNTLASELMQYDPDRKITEGVFESILLGAVAGGTVTTPFVGYQAYQDRNLSPDEQAVEQGVDPDTELTYTVSYVNPKNDEQSILNIQAANPEEAVRLATQGLGNRAVNIKYEGINTSDFKVEEEVTPDPVVEEEAVVEEEVIPEAEQAELQEELQGAVVEEAVTPEPAPEPTASAEFSISPEINPNYTRGSGIRKILGYKVKAKDGIVYYIEGRPDLEDPSLRFIVHTGDGVSGAFPDNIVEGYRTKREAVEALKRIEAPGAVVEEAVTPAPEPAPQPEPVQSVDLEAVKEQQDTIEDADYNISNLQSEIEIEKSNIKEARARNKKEIDAVRKSKIPKEEKSEKIEDLKASIQDEVDDMNGNIGIYKEEMSGFKKDLRKAKKKLAGLQPPDVVAEAAPVTGKPANVALTKVELKWFNELLENKVNREELLEEVPSLKIVDGKLSVEPQDAAKLDDFVFESSILDGLGTIPPRMRKYQFYSPFYSSPLTDERMREIDDQVSQALVDTTLTEQDIKDGKEGEHGVVVDTPVTGDVVADAAQIKPSRPVSVPNAPVISRSSLRGKSGFIYFSDRTRVGTYTGLNPESNISIPLQGGMGYAFIPQNVQAEAGWAFTSDNIFTRFRDKVNETDGIGYVALYTKENLRANGTFLIAYIAEVEYALSSGKLTKADFQSEINGLRERFLAKKVKDKDFISRDVDWYSLWNKQWKTPADLQAALDAAGFETRAAAFSAKKSTTKNAKPGDLSGGQLASKRSVNKGMPDVIGMIDLFAEPDLADRKRGEIIGAVQFQQGQESAVTASEIGSDNHLSYPLVIRGRGIGVFDSTVNVLDVIKTQKERNQALRSAETSFPTSSEVGTADATAQAAPIDGSGQQTPSQAEASRIQKFVEDNFGEMATKIGTSIEVNPSIAVAARYNASKGFIEINPARIVELQAEGQIDIVNDSYLKAVMREEMIHAAMSKVVLQKSKGKDEGQAFSDFMSDLGQSLTESQRTAISQVYSGLSTDSQFGAEYSRAAIQQALYGDITESYISKGPAFEKLKSLLKSVQSYLARTLGSEVKTNPEAAGVIRSAAEILQQVDPSARVINQAIVKEATARSAPVFPNSNYGFAVQGEPFNERKIEVTAFDKYAKTMNALLADIDPSLKGFSNQYYYNIESKSLDRLKAALPFVEKYRGIEKKSKRDFQRLKRLLLFSEVSVSERGQNFIKERDALLKKYGMYNDFQLGPRFILDEILDEGTKSGVEMGKVYDYMPRFINDLEKVKNYYGKSAKTGFREYLKGTKDSEGNVIIKGQNQEIKEARARLDELQEQGQPVPESVRELANKEIIPVLGGKETAYYEAIYFDDYLRQEGFKKPKGATPSSTKERTVGVLEGDLIPSKIIDAYDDIDVALERYIYNMTSSLETLRIIGRRYTYEDTGIKINKNEVPSDLSVLLRELVAANRITEEQAEGIIPDIFQRAVRVRKQEASPLELLRSLGYISGLVEFTSTLSQLLDTTFVTVKNNPIGTLSAILNNTVTGQMVGIDVEQIASEFVQDKTARTDGSKFAKAANLSNKSLRKLLMTNGFRQLDMRMKNANLTANFNRYRKLTNGYYRDRNSKKSKLFVSELTYLGLSPNQQIQFMAELKRFKPGKPNAEQFRNAPLVRQVLFSRLNESQPMSKGSRPLAATENPNAQILYMMKSFMVNQMNNARSEIINRIADTRLSNLERRRAVIDLLRLLAGLAAIGMPVAGLKDFIAGRLGYLNDYLINSLLSPLGISTYTGYKIQREGIFGAAVSYFAPVSLQMAGDMLLVMQRLAMGQKVQPKDITAFGPYSEVINRAFGFNTESQLRKYERKKKVGQKPIVIPSDIKLPQRLF